MLEGPEQGRRRVQADHRPDAADHQQERHHRRRLPAAQGRHARQPLDLRRHRSERSPRRSPTDQADALVFSDFRHGIFNRRTIPTLTAAIPEGMFKVADSQVASRWGNIIEFQGFDLITPNEREARFALGDQDSGVRPLAREPLRRRQMQDADPQARRQRRAHLPARRPPGARLVLRRRQLRRPPGRRASAPATRCSPTRRCACWRRKCECHRNDPRHHRGGLRVREGRQRPGHASRTCTRSSTRWSARRSSISASMRVIVVGLGVQGHKRRRFAGIRLRRNRRRAQSRGRLSGCARGSAGRIRRGAALHSRRGEDRTARLSRRTRQARARRKAAGRGATRRRSRELQRDARAKGVVLYIAYNHRFEPHFVRMRDLVKSGTLGRIYRCRMFYGNGTARLVRNSAWRDHGAGVLADLGSHLLDTARFWFGDIGDDVLDRIGQPLREPQPRPRRVRGARRTPAARIRNDAADLAQSFHLRRVRRERQRAHQLAVQVGTVRRSPTARAFCRAAVRPRSR